MKHQPIRTRSIKGTLLAFRKAWVRQYLSGELAFKFGCPYRFKAPANARPTGVLQFAKARQ